MEAGSKQPQSPALNPGQPPQYVNPTFPHAMGYPMAYPVQYPNGAISYPTATVGEQPVIYQTPPQTQAYWPPSYMYPQPQIVQTPYGWQQIVPQHATAQPLSSQPQPQGYHEPVHEYDVNQANSRKRKHKKIEPPETTSYRNGRWSSEEHSLFVIGLSRFGRNYTEIARIINGRTMKQIRSHAQKYMLRVANRSKKADIQFAKITCEGRPNSDLLAISCGSIKKYAVISTMGPSFQIISRVLISKLFTMRRINAKVLAVHIPKLIGKVNSAMLWCQGRMLHMMDVKIAGVLLCEWYEGEHESTGLPSILQADVTIQSCVRQSMSQARLPVDRSYFVELFTANGVRTDPFIRLFMAGIRDPQSESITIRRAIDSILREYSPVSNAVPSTNTHRYNNLNSWLYFSDCNNAETNIAGERIVKWAFEKNKQKFLVSITDNQGDLEYIVNPWDLCTEEMKAMKIQSESVVGNYTRKIKKSRSKASESTETKFDVMPYVNKLPDVDKSKARLSFLADRYDLLSDGITLSNVLDGSLVLLQLGNPLAT